MYDQDEYFPPLSARDDEIIVSLPTKLQNSA